MKALLSDQLYQPRIPTSLKLKNFNLILCSVSVQVERRLQLTSMAGCAIDEWIPIFDAVDVSQQIKNNGMKSPFSMIARKGLGLFNDALRVLAIRVRVFETYGDWNRKFGQR